MTSAMTVAAFSWSLRGRLLGFGERFEQPLRDPEAGARPHDVFDLVGTLRQGQEFLGDDLLEPRFRVNDHGAHRVTGFA